MSDWKTMLSSWEFLLDSQYGEVVDAFKYSFPLDSFKLFLMPWVFFCRDYTVLKELESWSLSAEDYSYSFPRNDDEGNGKVVMEGYVVSTKLIAN